MVNPVRARGLQTAQSGKGLTDETFPLTGAVFCSNMKAGEMLWLPWTSIPVENS